MARIGLKYPRYAKVTVTTDQSTGAETETYGTVKTAGRAVSADISINRNDNKFYADDNVAETDPEFIDGTITLGLDELTNEVTADLTGAALDSGEGGTGDLEFGARTPTRRRASPCSLPGRPSRATLCGTRTASGGSSRRGRTPRPPR